MAEQKATYTMEQVRKHRSKADCWVVIYGNVYNVTNYLQWHPGGDVLLKNSGRDVSYSFTLSHEGSGPRTIMEKYCIGKIREKAEEKAPNPHGDDEGRDPKRPRLN